MIVMHQIIFTDGEMQALRKHLSNMEIVAFQDFKSPEELRDLTAVFRKLKENNDE